MPGVSPHITLPGNCRQAIEFYQAALGARVVFLRTVGESPLAHLGPAANIIHCTLQVEDSTLALSDHLGPGAPASNSGNITLALGLHDSARARQIFAALAAGGHVIMPLEKTYWAEAFGMVTDPFGVKWMVNCAPPAAS